MNANQVFDRGLDLRLIDKENGQDIVNADPKLNPYYGFLHIPKTGGTSVVDFLSKVESLTISRPLLFFHSWDIPLIFDYFPRIKIAFVIRDPLERMVSGYQSRLRQGRPRYNQPWRGYEATAFSLFPSINSLLDALIKEDDFSIGATEYALSHILAIAWNYEFYFKSLQVIEYFADKFFLVGSISRMDEFLASLCKSSVIFDETVASENDILDHYTPKHQSDRPAQDILSEYTIDQKERIRDRLSREYQIYNRIHQLIQV